MNLSPRCTGPLSRRHFLRIGALALGGVGLRGLLPLQLQASEKGPMPDTSVILIWLPGGPPHLDTYDLKPEAPVEYRGEFRPIKTNVPGIEVCELLPMHAKIADKFALIRSIAHQYAAHDDGHRRFLTGRDPRIKDTFINDYPMVGSMVAKVRPPRQSGMLNYVAGTDPGRDGINVYSFGAAYLGPATHPFMVVGDPSSPTFKVNNLSLPREMKGRFNERLGLLEQLDNVPAEIDSSGTMTAIEENRKKAVSLALSDVASTAFDLSREPPRLRDRYGMHAWGQRALLARRLVEHGAAFVTMVMENPYQSGVPFPKYGVYNWDSHAVNCHIFDDARVRFPIYDRAVTALIEDIYARGLDHKVMLIVAGEFGRTPRIEYANGTTTNVKQPGRDHWPHAMSILVSGGSLRTGQVVGSTNAKGEHPKDRPLKPEDLWATMFRHLGIDYKNTSFLDHTGRPLPILTDGEPIAELL
jgi:hypothetical protein